MIGLLAELTISWLLLWLFYRKSLLALGIRPTAKRLRDFLFGFLIAAGCCMLYHISFVVFSGNTWTRNEHFTGHSILTSSWWTLNSVLFEELIFRGALLYIAIQKFGTKPACLISAITFGVYHLFSYNALGNIAQTIFIFFITGIWGLMFAIAFAGTRSLYLPVALHFGWNLVNIVVFSQGPLGNQLFVSTDGQKLAGAVSAVLFIFQLLSVPLITFWYLKRHSLLLRSAS